MIRYKLSNTYNLYIDIDGDKASGNWLFWVATRHKGVAPNQVFMSTDITYVRADEGWLIQTYNLHYGMTLNTQ